MTIINDTPAHVLDQSTINKLKNVNTTAIIDVLARNNYDIGIFICLISNL